MPIILEKQTAPERTFKERYFESRRRLYIAPSLGETALSSLGLERRFTEELESGFSEALSGRVVSDYDFDVSADGKVLAADGEELEQTMLRARRRAYEEARDNPDLSFVVDRYNVELEELHEQQQMIRGETGYNAVLTISPMTFELAHRPDLLVAGHQRPDLGRSLVRIALWDGSAYSIFTRSLDASTLDLLKRSAEAATGYTYSAQTSLRLLGERQKLSLTRNDTIRILDDITTNFDKLLFKKTGVVTVQGASALRDRDLLQFVRQHPQILQSARSEVEDFLPYCKDYTDFENRLNRTLYNHLALLEEGLTTDVVPVSDISTQADGAGKRASDSGVVFSMCGDLISRDPSRTTEVATGYDSLMTFSMKRVMCPNSRCKKMVVVEDRFLRKGILHCSECKHTVDVCGDNTRAERIKKAELKKAIRDEEKAIRRARKLLNKKERNAVQKGFRIWF